MGRRNGLSAADGTAGRVHVLRFIAWSQTGSAEWASSLSSREAPEEVLAQVGTLWRTDAPIGRNVLCGIAVSRIFLVKVVYLRSGVADAYSAVGVGTVRTGPGAHFEALSADARAERARRGHHGRPVTCAPGVADSAGGMT